MFLSSEIDGIIELLNARSELAECKVIKAYPYAKKPLKLTNSVITVSQSVIEAQNISLGEETLFGEYTVCVSAFIPQGSELPDISGIVIGIVCALKEKYPVRIKVHPLEAMDNISCYCVKCEFTFSSKIDLTEEEI